MIVPELLALSLAVVLAVAAFLVLWLDRYGTEPVVRIMLVAGWGLACPFLLRLADRGLGVAGQPGATVESGWVPAGIGLLEQLVLAAALALVATSRFLEGPVDGAVYGVAAGVGLVVSTGLMALPRPTPADWPGVPFFLALSGAATAAALGAGIGYAKLAVRSALRVPGAFAAVVLAGVLRWGFLALARWGWGVWGPANVPFNLALVVLAAALLAGVFLAAFVFERRVLEAQLGEEVRLGVLPEWVVEVVPRYGRRIRSGWWRDRDERREIVRLLTSLAYRKRHLRALPDESARLYGLEVGRLRQRARTLMALAPSGPGQGGEAGEERAPSDEETMAPRG